MAAFGKALLSDVVMAGLRPSLVSKSFVVRRVIRSIAHRAAARLIKPARNIVVLTGAGISAESGIKTFRDTGGLWEDHKVEDVASPEGFHRNPALVHEFYNLRRAALSGAKPNAAHIALAQLEAGLSVKGGRLTLITQNVDDLHERGGSKSVIHMHGELMSLLCSACGQRWRKGEDSYIGMACPKCSAINSTRPDIVWFGEMPYSMTAIEQAIVSCDLFVSIGTSGAVYPAAGFVQMARTIGKQTLELNLERSEGSRYFHKSRLGKAGEIVPKWVDKVLKA